MAALPRETPVADNAFAPGDSGIPESERQAKQVLSALPVEDKDTESAFPLDDPGIADAERNEHQAYPLENSTITAGGL